MHPEEDPQEEIRPAPDPTDLIVGTIRPPTWLATIPAGAWLFVALAAIDVAYRVGRDAPRSPDEVSLINVAGLLLSLVGGAAIVLLPGAILLGRERLGKAGSTLLQGGIALAAAELLRLVGNDVLNTVVGPVSYEPGLFGAPDLLVRIIAIEVPVILLRLFGLARIGLGLRAIAAPSRPFGRILYAAPAAALAVLLAADLLTIQISQAGPSTASDALGFAYNLLILVGEAVVFVLWAWIASLAYRQNGRTWRWIMRGALAIAVASVVTAIGWIVAVQQADPDDAQQILTWFGLAASAVGALGAPFLVVAFLGGFDSHRTGTKPGAAPGDAQGPDPFSGPAGV